MTDIDVTRLDSNQFQQLCGDLLVRIIPEMRPIDGVGGDDGIDGFVGHLKGSLVIYQYKHFDGRLNSSRKRQITDSFNTAKEKNPGMKAWTLMISIDFTPDEQKWFETELIEKNPDININYWGKQKIESLVCENDTLLEKYFNKSIMVAGKKAVKAIEYLSDPPIKLIMSHADEMKRITRENPHLGMKYVVDSEKNLTNVTFDPIQPIEFTVKLKFPKEKFGGEMEPNMLLDKLNSGDIITFEEGEVESVEFKNDELEDMIPEGAKLRMTIQPQYLSNKIVASVEIPNSPLFYDNVEMTPLKATADELSIELNNLPCEARMVISKNTGVAKFDFKYSMTGKPIFSAKRFINFLDAISKNKIILIREKESGKTLMHGIVNIDEAKLIDPFSRLLVEKLAIIEIYQHASFKFPEEVTEDEYNYLLMAADLLSTGIHRTHIKNMTLNIKFEGMEGFLKKYHEDGDEIVGIITRNSDVKINIFGVEIPLNEVERRLPKMKIMNIDEIREKMTSQAPLVGVVLSPINSQDMMEVIRVKKDVS